MENFSWPVRGHTKIQQFLQKSLANEKLAHAYLFSGPAHLGKSLVAEQFIASILCHDYQKQTKSEAKNLPCGNCIFCQQFKKGIHPDVYQLAKEEDKKNISVEQVREMHKFLSLTSFLNSYKVAIIANAQDLSESAQNALLKILEEPAPKTILILIASDHNFLLPTISSRCQLVKFRPLAENDIFEHLIGLGANRQQAKIFTALANGQIGLAIEYFQKPELFTAYLAKMNQLLALFDYSLTARFKSIDSVFSGTKGQLEAANSLQTDLDFWQLALRDILTAQQNLDNLLVNLHYQKEIKKLAARYSSAKILALLEQIRKIKQYLNININPRLAVENLLINL